MVKQGTCPNCGRCPYLEGTCVERIARGRRFFLMGALALPVAVQIERVATIVKPVYEAPKLTPISRIVFDRHVQDVLGHAVGAWFAVAT